MVNASPDAQPLEIELPGGSLAGGEAKLVRLHANSQADTNSITDPRHIVPLETHVPVAGKFHHEVPGYSIEVLELPVKK
jgi:alpha-N-arabinofuranosidase